MKFTPIALALASASFVLASPAAAQYGAPPPQKPPSVPTKGGSDEQAPQKGPSVSGAARKEIVALQTAVNAKDTAAIPAALAAAKGKAKTKDDNYIIAKLQLKAAADANDTNAMAQAAEAVLASGYADAAEQSLLRLALGKIYYNAKAYDKAGPALERVLQLDPNNTEAMLTLAETRNAEGRAAEGVALLQKAIATKGAAGQKPDQAWYKRALQIAFHAKLPSAPGAALQWVAAYPSPANWRDAIVIYQNSTGLVDSALLDSMRLARVAGALQGENDYYRYTNTLVTKGFPGEAKAVLEEAFAANKINKSSAALGPVYALATSRSQGDRASLAASATAAKTAPDAKKAMTTADAYYGYGDYAQAADLYRLAMTKAGVDKDLANLRLGMALTGVGDKAGATAAFNAAGGAQAPVAKLWLTYLAQKA